MVTTRSMYHKPHDLAKGPTSGYGLILKATPKCSRVPGVLPWMPGLVHRVLWRVLRLCGPFRTSVTQRKHHGNNKNCQQGYTNKHHNQQPRRPVVHIFSLRERENRSQK